MKAIILIGLLFAATFSACVWLSHALEKSQIVNRGSLVLTEETTNGHE